MEVPGRQNNDQKEATGLTDEKLCHTCKEDGDLQRAYGYCNDCEEDLCETCYKYHRRPKQFKDHKLVKHDIEEQESREETDTKPPPVPERRKYLDTKCQFHNNEELKYHCRSHGIIICSVCALKQHKGCQTVDYIPDIYETENKRVVEIIEYVEGKIEYKLKQEMDAAQVAEKSFESSMSAIKAQKGQVDRYFKEKEKYFNDMIIAFRDKSKGRENEIKDLAQKLKEDKSRVTPISADSDVSKYIAIQEIEINAKNINQKLPVVFAHPTLKMSYKQQHPLPALGEAAVVEHQGNISKKKIKLLRKVDVAGGKTSCGLVDAAMVSNGRVVFTDQRNERLILISDEHKPIFHDCSGKPWGVTCISETEIAVSFPYKTEVGFFNVNEAVSYSSRKPIKLLETPAGTRYLKSGSLLVVTGTELDDTKNVKLETWSLDGQLLNTIATMNYHVDRITLTVDQKILLCSQVKHKLCVLDVDGTNLKTFEFVDDNLSGPFGITSDASDNIYVCGQQCLRIVSKEGKWEEIISPEDGFAPQALQISQNTKKLYVGQGKGLGRTKVLIYQM